MLTTERAGDAPMGGGVMIAGLGMAQAAATGTRLRETLRPGTAVALSGLAYALHSDQEAGEVVVATELRAADGSATRHLPSAALVAGDLRRFGLQVRMGPIVSSSSALSPERMSELAAEGAIAWDMESAWLARQLPDHSFAVVRTIADRDREDDVGAGTAAEDFVLQPSVRLSLERWARASGPHDVVLASPRSFCAGVERAIEIVERALARFGGPVYVRRQIVHNMHVVSELESKGAIFVAELDQVPDGATVVLAAHGVSPAIRAAAAARADLNVIDATCPLVAKVHHEARRFVAQDYQIVLVGHAEHEEVIGTVGEAPERIQLVQDTDDVADLPFDDQAQVAYLTQTTLSTDETADVIDALRQRFPRLVGPTTTDICYATQNRQDAVRVVARDCDLMLVVGSSNSSNTARLVEVARREGCRSELIEDASEIDLDWLDHAAVIGVTAGASAPETLVAGVIDALRTLGPATVTEHRTTEETVQFSLPRQVR